LPVEESALKGKDCIVDEEPPIEPPKIERVSSPLPNKFCKSFGPVLKDYNLNFTIFLIRRNIIRPP